MIKSFKHTSSVIRQKGESEKRVPQESKARQNFPKTNTYVCVSGGKKCLFFGNFGVLCFLEAPVFRFALLPYYRRLEIITSGSKCPKLTFFKDLRLNHYQENHLF